MRRALPVALVVALAGCTAPAPPPAPKQEAKAPEPAATEYYGTTEPLAADAVYFVLTDRFVNGDKSNDQRKQGGGAATHTFDRPTPGAPEGRTDNVGYLGGDFIGILDNAV